MSLLLCERKWRVSDFQKIQIIPGARSGESSYRCDLVDDAEHVDPIRSDVVSIKELREITYMNSAIAALRYAPGIGYICAWPTGRVLSHKRQKYVQR